MNKFGKIHAAFTAYETEIVFVLFSGAAPLNPKRYAKNNVLE